MTRPHRDLPPVSSVIRICSTVRCTPMPRAPGSIGELRPCVCQVCRPLRPPISHSRSEEHTSELQSRGHLVCRLLLEKKNCKWHATEHPSRDISPRRTRCG